jgi:hypothetical protein
MKTVKSILMLMCIVSLTALTSCNKDDDTAGGGNASIIGKWKCTVENWNDNNNGIGYDSFVGNTWEFKDGGVLKMGDEMTTYTLDGNDIVIAGGIYSGTVTKLTSSTLILDLQYAISIGNNPYPTDHLEFTKQ